MPLHGPVHRSVEDGLFFLKRVQPLHCLAQLLNDNGELRNGFQIVHRSYSATWGSETLKWRGQSCGPGIAQSCSAARDFVLWRVVRPPVPSVRALGLPLPVECDLPYIPEMLVQE